MLKYLLLVAIVALIGVGGAWAYMRYENTPCAGVSVEIVNKTATTFVTEQQIYNELRHLKISNQPLKEINLYDIEKKLNSIDFIERSECHINTRKSNPRQKVLNVKIWQIQPVMRVFDNNVSYYLNKDGKRMKSVPTYYADVPIVKAKSATNSTLLSLLPIMNYVAKDKSLSALVEMYDVSSNHDVIIVPTIYGHVINFGSPDGYESKFKKLQLFYDKVMPVKGWMTYDTIAVKWDYQVVATRRQKVVKSNEQLEDWDEQPDSVMVKMLNQAPEEAQAQTQTQTQTQTKTKTQAQAQTKTKTKTQTKTQTQTQTKTAKPKKK